MAALVTRSSTRVSNGGRRACEGAVDEVALYVHTIELALNNSVGEKFPFSSQKIIVLYGHRVHLHLLNQLLQSLLGVCNANVINFGLNFIYSSKKFCVVISSKQGHTSIVHVSKLAYSGILSFNSVHAESLAR